ncbi:uncharacterized protein PHALS_13154 [Plasmopara halstedii]|uniref:RxLR-like protein n=1 Tax=Plasmopara halstedii TaxID=4781 RepID=A0A0P1AP26_PLAHL|nr:uncharacterized protein PHALS_13154 [Plasmopara halstedii]CEG42919.1 hypothetical protein PHALS_13154 [Plasmopara halstedii]|eukprot:XP_024579288.1 hypothetical protein PHALS_13154 [Plasmopara halstedii]
MLITVKVAILVTACVAACFCGCTGITFDKTDLSGDGNAQVVAPDPTTSKTPCPALPQPFGALDEDSTLTDAPVVKLPCPALPQPSLFGSLSSDSSDSSGSTFGKAPCPSLQTASTSSDGSVSAPCPKLIMKVPCPSLPIASGSSSEDQSSEFQTSGCSNLVHITGAGWTVVTVSALALSMF